MAKYYLYVTIRTHRQDTNFDRSHEQAPFIGIGIAAVEVQMQHVTVSASNSRLLDLPGGAFLF
jgi:hypothetical protein